MAMVLMVIAPLYRIDILMVYPVVFFIFLFQRKSVKESITRSAFLAVLILLFVTIGYWGLRANPLTALTGYNGMNETHSFASQVKFAVFTFYTILNCPYGFGCPFPGKEVWNYGDSADSYYSHSFYVSLYRVCA